MPHRGADPSKSHSPTRNTVLVVDDDPSLVALLRTALTAQGYHVETATNGTDAYRHVTAEHCACMLLDIAMPGINGAELLLLMQTEGIRVPTIVMTAFKDFDAKEMKQFANVVQLFYKPFSLHDVLAAVKKHTP